MCSCVQETNDYLLCLKITEHLDYTVGGATFHYFGVDPTTEYGLRFRSQDDAVEFSKRIIEVKTGLLKGELSSAPSRSSLALRIVVALFAILHLECTLVTSPESMDFGNLGCSLFLFFHPVRCDARSEGAVSSCVGGRVQYTAQSVCDSRASHANRLRLA